MSRSADERGLAAPVVVALAGLLTVLTLLGGVLGRLLVDQRRASSAADLAALAGAGALQLGQEPCAAAGRSARSNDAELLSCTISGERVRVTSAVRVPGSPGLIGLVAGSVSVEATAEAGPVR
jgi:secretion/DNA translocation related TadE-like protein